jgi:hypothetical protein
MKSQTAKLVLSVFAVAMVTSHAFAKSAQQTTQNNVSLVYSSVVYSAIAGHGSEGKVVAIPDPDQSGPSQR